MIKDKRNIIKRIIESHSALRTKINYNKDSELIIQCPYCSIDRPSKLKLYIDSDREIFHCFRCGVSGSLRSLFDYLSIDYDLLNYFTDSDTKQDIQIETNNNNTFKLQSWMLVELSQYAMKSSSYLYNVALDYLNSRGLTYDDLKSFNKYTVIITNLTQTGRYHIDYMSQKYLFYIILPTFDGRYFAARLYDQSVNKKRYLFLPKAYSEVKVPVFGWFDNSNYSVLNIVEGHFDAIKLHKYKPDQHILVLGGKSKLTLYNYLYRQYSRIVYWLDNDIKFSDLKDLSQFDSTYSIEFRYSSTYKDIGDTPDKDALDTFTSVDVLHLKLLLLKRLTT